MLISTELNEQKKNGTFKCVSTLELDVTVLYTVPVRINILLVMSGRLPPHEHEETSFKVVPFCW